MLCPTLHYRREAFGTASSSEHHRPRFGTRGFETLPSINKLGTSDLICSSSSRYPAVHGDTSLGVSNVVAKTRWLGIGYTVQHKPISYCVAGGTSRHPDPMCRYSLPGEVRMFEGTQPWETCQKCGPIF